MNDAPAGRIGVAARWPWGQSWLTGAGYLGLYWLLDWASHVEPLPHTSSTPWNPSTGVAMALLLGRGVHWAPLVAFAIFTGELWTDVGPSPWQVLALTSTYLAAVYASTAWGRRRRGLGGPTETPGAPAWLAAAVAVATGCASPGCVASLLRRGRLARADG